MQRAKKKAGGAHVTTYDPQLEQYMAEVNRHPILTREAERALAERFIAHQDVAAAHELVVANLRFVAKVAHGYARYGLRLLDLIQEGNVGLMVAVKRFNPARGYRLITYAVWWIRAYIQSYIMRSWSLVRLGATRLHRKLFFRLRALRAEAQRRAQMAEAGATSGAQDANTASQTEVDADAIWGVDAIYREVAGELGTTPRAAADMGRRLAARDFSLDVKLGDEADAPSHLDRLPATQLNQEEALASRQDAALRAQAVSRAVADLTDKERAIVQKRLLAEVPETLAGIGKSFGVSRERIRQIETRAVAKLRQALQPALV